jgi:hypothetical protein
MGLNISFRPQNDQASEFIVMRKTDPKTSAVTCEAWFDVERTQANAVKINNNL